MVAGPREDIVNALHVNSGLESLPHDGTPRAVTIGKFDGVHRGHRRVIDHLRAEAHGAEPTVITFDRHPHAIVKPDQVPRTVVSDAQKVELLAEAGIQRVVILPFDEKLSSLSHEDFSRTVLAEGLSASLVLVGSDFRYGFGGEGDITSLRTEGLRHGFRVEVAADVCESGGSRVSSTMIREALDRGEVGEVRELLGRWHSVRGQVGKGFQRGRVLGYPTANLSGALEGYVPADGVYATVVTHKGVDYHAATSIGVNPTFGDVSERTMESHLLDATLDLYGDVITVHFVQFIRGMRKFPDAEALASQMGLDEQNIRVVLAERVTA
jgi:riboflavin kinase / FMN adenylyltransferase